MNPVIIGSVSEGTLRPQDLFPRFLNTLKEHNPNLWVKWTTPGTDEYVQLPQARTDPCWDSNELGEALNDLVEALDELAPPQCYFGLHVINSTDYGFWYL